MNVKESTLNILAIGLFNARSRHVASTDLTGHAERNCETLLSPVWHLGIIISCHIYSATASGYNLKVTFNLTNSHNLRYAGMP